VLGWNAVRKGEVPGGRGDRLVAVRHCLEAGGTSFENVVMVRIYATNAGFYNVINWQASNNRRKCN
jgi:2-iminobutanoate/2-iminopropanoate deaminase